MSKLKVGNIYINKNNGGQKILITSLNFNGMDNVIGYSLYDSFKYSSLAHSNCTKKQFIKTFSEY